MQTKFSCLLLLYLMFICDKNGNFWALEMEPIILLGQPPQGHSLLAIYNCRGPVLKSPSVFRAVWLTRCFDTHSFQEGEWLSEKEGRHSPYPAMSSVNDQPTHGFLYITHMWCCLDLHVFWHCVRCRNFFSVRNVLHVHVVERRVLWLELTWWPSLGNIGTCYTFTAFTK